MIAYLKGKLIQKQTDKITLLLEVGIGYYVRISHHTYDHLPGKGEEAHLHIHHHISENDQQLFGFFSTEERSLFELLITVKGIGPRLALALLSAMPPNQVIDAIVQQNASLIARSPGIGKKSAERIVLELRDKLGDIAGTRAVDGDTRSFQNETISALEALGYPISQAQKAVREASKEIGTIDNVSDFLKKALKHLQ